MRSSLLFISLLTSLATAQTVLDCTQPNGPVADQDRVIEAFIDAYTTNGIYAPVGDPNSETLCMVCGNAEMRGTNNCADSAGYTATVQEIRDLIHQAGSDDECSFAIEDAGDGCLPFTYGTKDWLSPPCEVFC